MACNNWIKCDNESRRNLGWWQLFQLLITGSGDDDCPAVRVKDGDVDATLAAILNFIKDTPNKPTSPTRGYKKNITDTTAQEVLPAGGNGIKNYITQILVTNASTSVGTVVDIIEETSGDILCTGYAAPEGGFSVSLPTPKIQSTANKAIQAKCTTTGANVYVDITGYKV